MKSVAVLTLLIEETFPGFSPLISISLLFHIFTGSEETLEKAKVRILSSIFARKLILWTYDLPTCSNYIGTSSPFLKPHCHVLIPWPRNLISSNFILLSMAANKFHSLLLTKENMMSTVFGAN